MNRAAVLKLAFPRITIIDRYVALEVLLPFGMGVGLLTFTLVTGRMLKLTEMVVNHGVSVGEVVGLIAYIMPAFLELTLGMAVLQKNDPQQTPELEGYFDGALSEQCNQYSECEDFAPYIAAGKPVLNAEYHLPTKKFCAADEARGFMGARFAVALNGKRFQPCW